MQGREERMRQMFVQKVSLCQSTCAYVHNGHQIRQYYVHTISKSKLVAFVINISRQFNYELFDALKLA